MCQWWHWSLLYLFTLCYLFYFYVLSLFFCDMDAVNRIQSLHVVGWLIEMPATNFGGPNLILHNRKIGQLESKVLSVLVVIAAAVAAIFRWEILEKIWPYFPVTQVRLGPQRRIFALWFIQQRQSIEWNEGKAHGIQILWGSELLHMWLFCAKSIRRRSRGDREAKAPKIPQKYIFNQILLQIYLFYAQNPARDAYSGYLGDKCPPQDKFLAMPVRAA